MIVIKDLTSGATITAAIAATVTARRSNRDVIDYTNDIVID